LGQKVTADELAALLGIAPRTVRELAGRAIVVKAGRGKYDLTASVGTYCAHLREQAAGRAGDAQAGLTTERARQAKEMADNVALKNAALRRDLVSAAAVTAEWSGILRRLRARILAIPPRVNQRLPFLKQHDVGVIDAELRQALTELGQDDRAPA
jgi:phage terminase Nu1 subunit (DNA packaging protein)